MIASVERLFTAPVQRDPLGVHRPSRVARDGRPADLQSVLAALNGALARVQDLRHDVAHRMDVLEDGLKEISRQLHAPGKQAA
ncbi:MAG: hypothetical protein ACREF3_05610 [Acetobacteraceae bacterium]